MLNKLIAQSFGIFFFAGFAFAACGEDAPSTPQAQYCAQVCDCNKCSDSERASCLDDALNFQDDAKNRDCGDSYQEYITCVTKDGSCEDGAYDESACFNEETDVKNCINPPPACESNNDGICDEPAPAGNGKCAKGSDKTDCAVKPCLTTNDGVCDEPKGTNTCELGSDPVDCAPEPCPYVNNGECDEPGGTGLCETGSDTVDCFCATANNGVCDEPQGTGTCAGGTDTLDCAPCVYCADYINTFEGKLCPNSQALYNALKTCTCTGSCQSTCASTLCVDQYPTQTCSDCSISACNSQLAACASDI